MGITVAILGFAIVVITFFAFKSFDGDPAIVVGVRVGLIVLIASQILGGAIIANGELLDRDPLETNPAIFGEAGVMKLPHAVTMHAVQVLPPADLTPLALGVVVAGALLGGIAIFGLTAGLFRSKPVDPPA